MRFLSQAGVSIVQGLVISAVVAGSALVATRLINDQKKLQKGVETRDQIEELHKLVFAVVQNREHCKATLVNAGIATPGVVLDQTYPLTQIVSKIATGSIQPNFYVNTGATMDQTKIYMSGNVMINSMVLITPSSTDLDPLKRTLTYPSMLRVEYARLEGNDANKRTKVGYGAKRIKKDIPIILQLGTLAAGKYPVDGCYAVQMGASLNGVTNEGNNNLNQEFCSNLGSGGSLYTWDSSTNKCEMKNNVCPDKYIFSGISSTGDAICYPINDYLPYLIETGLTSCDTTSGAIVSLVTDAAGKVKIACSAAAGASCGLPWGGTVGHGSCVNAFSILSANNCSAGTFPTCRACIDYSELRCCNNGTLSGSYTIQTCSDYCGGGLSCI